MQYVLNAKGKLPTTSRSSSQTRPRKDTFDGVTIDVPLAALSYGSRGGGGGDGSGRAVMDDELTDRSVAEQNKEVALLRRARLLHTACCVVLLAQTVALAVLQKYFGLPQTTSYSAPPQEGFPQQSYTPAMQTVAEFNVQVVVILLVALPTLFELLQAAVLWWLPTVARQGMFVYHHNPLRCVATTLSFALIHVAVATVGVHITDVYMLYFVGVLGGVYGIVVMAVEALPREIHNQPWPTRQRDDPPNGVTPTELSCLDHSQLARRARLSALSFYVVSCTLAVVVWGPLWNSFAHVAQETSSSSSSWFPPTLVVVAFVGVATHALLFGLYYAARQCVFTTVDTAFTLHGLVLNSIVAWLVYTQSS